MLETSGIVRGQSEAIRPKGIPIHLAEIIRDLSRARVGVFELQDRLAHFSRGSADLDGAAAGAGVQEGLGVGASLGSEGGFGGAGFGVLAAGVEVDGEAAVVEYCGLARRIIGDAV